MLSVLTFRTPAEAIAKANNTPYGLSAGIWSDKGSRILAVADQLRAGVIWANTFNRFDPASPFGGYKESGYGREGGRHGLARLPRAERERAGRSPRRAQEGRSMTACRAQDLQALHRRQVPAQRVRPHLRGRLDRRARSSRTPRRRPARTPATRSSPPAARVNGWSGATAYNRGQVLYRIAELLEGRRAQFVDEIVAHEGVSRGGGPPQVDEAIDRWVWYAGWADKYVQVAGNGNPVAGPYFNISVPEPTGVVAIIAPQDSLAARARLGRRAGARRPATPSS